MDMTGRFRLVEEPLASGSATEAGNAIRAPNLTLELVVVGQLLVL